MDSFTHLPFFHLWLGNIDSGHYCNSEKKKVFLFAISEVQLLTGDSRNAKIPGTAAEPAPSEAEINAPSCTLISSAFSLPPSADSAVKVSHISKLAFHP